MEKLKLYTLLAATALTLGNALFGQVAITEVNPNGSSSSYAADWFELTNFGGSAVDLTGWKMDDASASFATSVGLRGVTSLAPGQSVVFLEGDATGTTDSTINANFINAWYGSGGAPAGFVLGNYGGSGVGLGGGGDAVNIYNSSGVLVASVTFGTSTVGKTFDNAAAINGAAISTLSAVGVKGAFTSFNAAEIGSPGAIPEPSTYAAIFGGVALAGAIAWRCRRAA